MSLCIQIKWYHFQILRNPLKIIIELFVRVYLFWIKQNIHYRSRNNWKVSFVNFDRSLFFYDKFFYYVVIDFWITCLFQPWMATDEDMVSHVLSHVVWWKFVISVDIPSNTGTVHSNGYSLCNSWSDFRFSIFYDICVF